MAFNFSKIKGLFVVEDETTEKNEQSEETQKKVEVKKQPDTKQAQFSQNQTVQTTKVVDNSAQTSNTSLPDGGFNQQIFESLVKAIQNANLPGEDYFEYAESLKAMKDIPLDEKIKIQTVLATLSTKGLTVQTVFDSADYYIKVLDNEKNKFYDAMKAQTNNLVVKKQKDIETLDKEIKAKSDQIALLTQEITKNQQEIEKIRNEMAQADNKIKSTEGSFVFTFEFVVNQIRENISKLKAVITK